MPFLDDLITSQDLLQKPYPKAEDRTLMKMRIVTGELGLRVIPYRAPQVQSPLQSIWAMAQ